MKKKILFIHNSRLSHLPPFLALLDYLIGTGRYDITVIVAEREKATYDEYCDKINIINYHRGRKNNGVYEKWRIRFCQTLLYWFKLRKDLKKIPYDILWVIHVNSVIPVKGLLKDKKFIFSDYEWYDHDKTRYDASKYAARLAAVNVVCEENRAWFAKCDFKLKELPIVLPNKPWKRYDGAYKDVQLQNAVSGKKVVLYQGVIHWERPIEKLCESIAEMPNYCLLLLGQDSEYAKYLRNKYKNVFFHEYVTPPHHLAITKMANIGVVVYDDKERLNCAYCAPNKIWEYSMFGIPMLYNRIPGLNYSIGAYNAGEPVDLTEKESVLQAIRKIDSDYNKYSRAANDFYESSNIGVIIENILKKYEDDNSTHC